MFAFASMVFSFLGGPVAKALVQSYQAKLAAGNTSEKIASETASAEIAAQTAEMQSITQYRIASLGRWYEPDKLMGYTVAIYFAKLLIWDKCLGLGATEPLLGWSGTVATAIVGFYFTKRGFENVARIIRK